MSHGHKHFHGWTNYIPRTPPPGAYDWETGDFTIDSAYHSLDISNIVPDYAFAFWGTLRIKDANTNMYAIITGTSGSSYDGFIARTQVANLIFVGSFICQIRTAQTIYYTVQNGMDEVKLLIAGWFVK